MCSLIPSVLFRVGGKTSGTRGSSNKLLLVWEGLLCRITRGHLNSSKTPSATYRPTGRHGRLESGPHRAALTKIIGNTFVRLRSGYHSVSNRTKCCDWMSYEVCPVL